MGALQAVPAVVLPSAAATGLAVDLLPGILAHVSYPEVAGRGGEGEPPGIAQPVGPDLGLGVAATGEGIAGRNAVRLAAGRPGGDPKDLAQQRAQRLAVIVGIALAASVAQPAIEIAIVPEAKLPAVVVGIRLLDEEQLAAARLIHAAAHGVLDDPRVSIGVGVVQVQVAAVRREGYAEQALLAAALEHLADVEHRPAIELPVV